MWTKKEWIIFLAGAATLHTLTHISLQFTTILPINYFGIELTPQLNIYVSVISVIITAGLFWWAQSCNSYRHMR